MNQAFVVTAQIAGIPDGYQPWTLLQVIGPANHPAYLRFDCVARTRIWPGPQALIAADGKLHGHGFCAGNSPDDIGLQCRLTLVVADADTSAKFIAYNSAANQAQTYPGMDITELSGDVRQVTSIVLTRSHSEVPAANPCKPTALPISGLPGVTGSFTLPAANSKVEQAFAVKARISTIPAGYQPWTLLQVIGPAGHPTFQRNGCVAATRVWPGPEPLTASGEGLHGAAFCAGVSAADVGLQCRLILILADSTASAAFRAYQKGATAKGFPGLASYELPSGIKRVAEIVIARKASSMPPSPQPPTPNPSPACSTPVLGLPQASISGSFMNPTDQSAIAQLFTIKVQSDPIPGGSQLWTLLQVIGPATHPTYLRNGCVAATRIWPGPQSLASDGSGYGFCGGNTTQDAGLRCRLTLVLADSTASARLTAYNNTAAANGYPGLGVGDLTGVVQRVASVVVTRQ